MSVQVNLFKLALITFVAVSLVVFGDTAGNMCHIYHIHHLNMTSMIDMTGFVPAYLKGWEQMC